MKKLFAIAILFTAAIALQAQTMQVYEGTATKTEKPEDWKERWFELNRAERAAVFADPKVDPLEIHQLIEDRRAEMASMESSKAGGDELLFGCAMWFDHNLIDAQVLNGTNWTEFDGGCGAGAGVDVYEGPIDLPFDFCFFGDTYDDVYISSKGALTFNDPMCDWTPEGFPAATVDIIAGFWADSDFTGVGLCYYEVLDDAFVVTFLQVGYWPGQGNFQNSFQMIMSDGTSSLLPPGYQVGFIYGDMQWTHGGVGGGSGCCGPTPATVGVDKASGTEHYQIGRFNFLDDSFNGQYDTGDESAGVDFLDDKSFYFMTCDSGGDTPENHPPISSNNNAAFNGFWTDLACDTVTVCLGETVQISGDFFAPEQGEIITIDIDLTEADNATVLVNEGGEWGTYLIEFEGSEEYIGYHDVYVTGIDNGSPVAETVLHYVVCVLDAGAPEIEVVGVSQICAGQFAELSVEPGDLDYYIWSSGCQGPEPDCSIGFGGTFTVTAYDGQCNATETFEVEEASFTIPGLDFDPSPFACFGDTVTVCFEDEYPFGQYWECFLEDDDQFPCNLITPDDELDGECIEVGPGYYAANTIDEDGCEGRNVFQVFSQESEVPLYEFDPFCDEEDLVPVTFEGGFANPGEGNLLIYMTDPEGDFANGSFVQVEVICDGDTTDYNFSMVNNGTFDLNSSNQQIPIEFGCQVSVEFIQSGDDDGNTSLQVFNCGSQNQVYSGTPDGTMILWEGEAACEAEPAIGTWTVDACPCEGTFSDDSQFNTTFTPCDYGFYTLSFAESVCGIQTSFELEYTSAPDSVVFEPGFGLDLCPGESVTFTGDFLALTDCGADITWENAVQDPDNPLMATYTHPGNGNYEDVDVELTVSNGCGTDSYFIDVEANQTGWTAELEDITLCDGGSTTLDPISGDTPDIDYLWSGPGVDGNDNPQVTVDESGTYEVICFNACDEQTVSVNVILAEPWTPNWLPQYVECDEDDFTLDIGNVPAGYTWCWTSDCINANQDEFTVDGLGSYTITIQVQDDEGCDTYMASADVVISIPPTLFPDPEPQDTSYICPNEIETFDLGFGIGETYTWTIDCPGSPLIFNNDDETLEVISSMFGPDCLEVFVDITGSVENICGQLDQTWIMMASLCPVTAPNVISPNEDNLGNNALILDGIEVYDHTELYVFDRWGNEVFVSLNYDNKWRAPDVAEGTYYYMARMYDSQDNVVREIETSLTILR